VVPASVTNYPLVHSPVPKQFNYSSLLQTAIASSVYLTSGFSVIKCIKVDGMKPKQMEDPSGTPPVRTTLYSVFYPSSSKK
jgi:hypothetical protein